MMSLHFAILSASNRFSSVASREDSVIVLVALFIFYCLTTFFTMIVVKGSTKRSKSKVSQEYPYFQHGIFYKTFFLGLNGKMPKSIVVLSFIVNISCILFIPFIIWNCITPHVIPTTITRVLGGVSFVAMIIRGFIFMFTNFKL